MTGIALLLAAAAAGFGLAQWLRLPVIPLLIALGFALGQFGPGLDGHETRQMLEAGLAFLMFSAGLALNPKRFARRARAVLWVGLGQFAVASVAGFLAALALGFDSIDAHYLGAALSTSSTLVVVHELYRQPGRTANYARLVTGVLLLQDALIIAVIVALQGAVEGPAGVARGLGALAAIATAAGLLQRWLPRALPRIGTLDEERLLLGALAVLFAFAGLSATAGLPFVAGAFAAGFALSGFPLSGLVRSVLGSLNTFFLALFFTALGATVRVPSPSELLAALALVATLLLVTPPLVTALAEWKGKASSRGAITAGLLVAQASEFAVVLALYGQAHGHISDGTLSVVALVAVTSMTLTPFLATRANAERLLRFHPLRRRITTRSELDGHVVMLGYGTSGQWVLRPLLEAGHEVVVVEQDPVVVDLLRAQGVTAVRGDAGDERVLARAGTAKARLVVATLPDTDDILKAVRHAGGTPVVARVFEEADAHAVAAAGGTPVLNSMATADRFMEWFDTVLGGHGPKA
jgi:Kef-type K+ transport system membrane component KefB